MAYRDHRASRQAPRALRSVHWPLAGQHSVGAAHWTPAHSDPSKTEHRCWSVRPSGYGAGSTQYGKLLGQSADEWQAIPYAALARQSAVGKQRIGW